MDAQTTVNTTRNGLDMELLQETAAGLREHPEAATVTIRTRHRWNDGFAVDGYTEEFAEAEEVTPRTFTFRTDLAARGWRPRQRPGTRRGDPWRPWRLRRDDLHH
jgi:hypothetical protein